MLNPRIDAIITLVSKKGGTSNEYQISIGSFPHSTCQDFIEIVIKFKTHGQWYNCKHFYYVYRVICVMNQESNMFVYALIPSFREIK